MCSRSSSGGFVKTRDWRLPVYNFVPPYFVIFGNTNQLCSCFYKGNEQTLKWLLVKVFVRYFVVENLTNQSTTCDMFGFNFCVYFDKIGRFLASQPTACRCDKKLAGKNEHKMSFEPRCIIKTILSGFLLSPRINFRWPLCAFIFYKLYLLTYLLTYAENNVSQVSGVHSVMAHCLAQYDN